MSYWESKIRLILPGKIRYCIRDVDVRSDRVDRSISTKKGIGKSGFEEIDIFTVQEKEDGGAGDLGEYDQQSQDDQNN